MTVAQGSQGFWALGLMSGTSLDGVDAALIQSDGHQVFATSAALTLPYPEDFRARLRACLGQVTADSSLVRDLTDFHISAARQVLENASMTARQVTVIGLHGQTIFHDPGQALTVQIGDAAYLAKALGCQVVHDFRSADVAAGGQGAPLAPIFHHALAKDLELPLVVLNLGGVGNLTWIAGQEEELLAFDTGPGNALLDDWMQARGGQARDQDGRVAAQGRVDEKALAKLLDHSYFAAKPPKSLDRDAFSLDPVAGLDLADGAATLTAFTAQTVASAAVLLPTTPRRWLVSGGGRHNPSLMRALAQVLSAAVDPVEAVGWQGDDIEAQAFGFMALRSLAGLPLSYPGTTGVPTPLAGGRLVLP